jgi:ribosomal protein L29
MAKKKRDEKLELQAMDVVGLQGVVQSADEALYALRCKAAARLDIKSHEFKAIRRRRAQAATFLQSKRTATQAKA